MRAVIQRVSAASVTVDNTTISAIGRGLLVLVGIGVDDTAKDSDYLINKILTLRLFDDGAGGMWRRSVKEIEGEVLCVSQFTLLANTLKGTKPDFHNAMPTAPSKALYTSFLASLRAAYPAPPRLGERIHDGQFGALMSVALTNEGPVTITLDSRRWAYVGREAGADAGGKEQGQDVRAEERAGKAEGKRGGKAKGSAGRGGTATPAGQPAELPAVHAPPAATEATAGLTAAMLGVGVAPVPAQQGPGDV